MKKSIYLLLIILLTTGCHTADTGDYNVAVKATLTFPAQNSVCVSGTVISATQSSIIFTWGASAFTDSYELDIKNLLTSATITQNVTTNQATVTLDRKTPYSWYVVSKNSLIATAKSDTWKFYNAGVGVVSYSPFPAAITLPGFGQSITATGGTVNLTWGGSDVDNDIVGYDVYFGTNATPAIFKSNITDMFLNNVAVVSGSTYYWKVITKDSQGNTSDSGIFQFKVN